MTARDALSARIRVFIDSSLLSEPCEPFEALALDIHRWQLAHDPVLASLQPQSAHSWQGIAAVPVELFKHVAVGTVKTAAPVRFMTSGTTGGGRGVHRLRDVELYDHGSLAWMTQCVPEAPTDIAALLHDPAVDSASSLSHMIALFGRCTWHLHDAQLDIAGLEHRVRSAPGALFVAATAFALADWLDTAPAPLPAGSVLMVTGGFKGRRHRLDGDALYDEARDLLQPGRLVTEYGMTELCSQLWGTPGHAYRPPPWMRAYAVDPVTGTPRPTGVPGQLRFVDLCNLDSTLAIETLDEGIVDERGQVTLIGRLRGSPARGCSLTIEEGWEARS